MTQPDGSYEDAFDELIDRYYETDDARSKLAVLEEAIRLADGAGDLHGGFGLRMELIECASFTDQKDKSLVAFSWCLAQADKNPGELDDDGLLWKYKWILEHVPTFCDVTKERIYQLQDDMEKRLVEDGYNLRPIQFLRWTNAMRMGEIDRAREYLALWKETTRDEMADCEACEQNKLSELLGRLGQAEEAIKCAGKLIDGSMGCAEVPHLTYGHLVAQYWKLGRVDEIKQLQPTWYKVIRDNPEFLEPVSEQMLLVAATGQLPEATALFERHAPWAAETVNEHNRCVFFHSASVLMEQIARAGNTEIKIRIPPEFDCYREDSTYDPVELAKWFRQKTSGIAARFDARNGNRYYQELAAQADALVASVG